MAHRPHAGIKNKHLHPTEQFVNATLQSIQVVVRVRPLTRAETAEGAFHCMIFPNLILILSCSLCSYCLRRHQPPPHRIDICLGMEQNGDPASAYRSRDPHNTNWPNSCHSVHLVLLRRPFFASYSCDSRLPCFAQQGAAVVAGGTTGGAANSGSGFGFDRVFGPDAPTRRLYEETARGVVLAAMEGAKKNDAVEGAKSR